MTSRTLVRAAAVALSFVCLSTPAFATPVTIVIGSFSFDVFNPAGGGIGTSEFRIENATGDNAVYSPDAAFPLLFSSLVVTVVDELGASLDIPLLGETLGPGVLPSLASLQFPDTTFLLTATLVGAIDIGSFALPDGRLFTADSLLFSVPLFPSGVIVLPSGEYALAPLEIAGIELTGDAAAVPEPSTLVLLGSGVALLARHRRRRTAS